MMSVIRRVLIFCLATCISASLLSPVPPAVALPGDSATAELVEYDPEGDDAVITEALHDFVDARRQAGELDGTLQLEKRDLPPDMYVEWDGAADASPELIEQKDKRVEQLSKLVRRNGEGSDNPAIREAAGVALEIGTRAAYTEFLTKTKPRLEEEAEAAKAKQGEEDLATLRQWESEGGGEFFRQELDAVIASADPAQYRTFIEFGADNARRVDDAVEQMHVDRLTAWKERLQVLKALGGHVGEAAGKALSEGEEGLAAFLDGGYVAAEEADAAERLATLDKLRGEVESAERESEEARRAAELNKAWTDVVEGSDASVKALLAASNAVAGAAAATKSADKQRLDNRKTGRHDEASFKEPKEALDSAKKQVQLAFGEAQRGSALAESGIEKLKKLGVSHDELKKYSEVAKGTLVTVKAASLSVEAAAASFATIVSADKAKGEREEAEADRRVAGKWREFTEKQQQVAEDSARSAKRHADAAESAAARATAARDRVLAAEREAKKRVASAKKHEERAKKQADIAHAKRLVAEREEARAAAERKKAQRAARIAASARARAQAHRRAANASAATAKRLSQASRRAAGRSIELRDAARNARDDARFAESQWRAAEARAAALRAVEAAVGSQSGAAEASRAARAAAGAASSARGSAVSARKEANKASGAAAQAEGAARRAEGAAANARKAARDADVAATRSEKEAAAAERDAAAVTQLVKEAEADARVARHAQAVAYEHADGAATEMENAGRAAAKAAVGAEFAQQAAASSTYHAQASVVLAQDARNAAGAASRLAALTKDTSDTAVSIVAPFSGDLLSAKLAERVAGLAAEDAGVVARRADEAATQAEKDAEAAEKAAKDARGDAKAAFSAAAKAAAAHADAARSYARAVRAAAKTSLLVGEIESARGRLAKLHTQVWSVARSARGHANRARGDARAAGLSAKRAEQQASAARSAANQARKDAQAAVSAAQNAERAAATAEKAAADAASYAQLAQEAAIDAANAAVEAEQAADRAEEAEAERLRAAYAESVNAGSMPDMPADEQSAMEREFGPDWRKDYDEAKALVDGGLVAYLKQNGLDILLDVLGVNDVKNCLLHGDVEACLWTVVGMIPITKLGAVTKALVKGGAKLARYSGAVNDARRLMDKFHSVGKQAKKFPGCSVLTRVDALTVYASKEKCTQPKAPSEPTNVRKISYEKWKAEDRNTFEESIYFRVDSDGHADYVGITKDVERRKKEHRRTVDYEMDLKVVAVQKRGQARAIEQYLIERCPEFANVINSISPLRLMYKDALAEGEQLAKDLKIRIPKGC